MKKTVLPVNFEDARGSIRDIFVDRPQQHVTIITTAQGGARGNHFHKVSVQSDYLVSGSFDVYSQKAGEEKVTHDEWHPGELLEWDAGEAHEFVAREESVFVTFVNGPRGGDQFESDTFRIPKPLHEIYAEQN